MVWGLWGCGLFEDVPCGSNASLRWFRLLGGDDKGAGRGMRSTLYKFQDVYYYFKLSVVNSAGLWSCGVSVVLATDYLLRMSAVAETMQASPPGYAW